MVDTKEILEGLYIKVRLVKASPTKKCVILNEPTLQKTRYENQQLTCNVEIDGKQKIWHMNEDSVRNLSEKYGTETKHWISKIVQLTIIKGLGKEKVVGTPT